MRALLPWILVSAWLLTVGCGKQDLSSMPCEVQSVTQTGSNAAVAAVKQVSVEADRALAAAREVAKKAPDAAQKAVAEVRAGATNVGAKLRTQLDGLADSRLKEAAAQGEKAALEGLARARDQAASALAEARTEAQKLAEAAARKASAALGTNRLKP
jgi:hypothetical protein